MKIKSLFFVAMAVASLTGCERVPEKIYNATDPGSSLFVAVKSVSIDNPAPTIKEGENVILTATVLPEKASVKRVVWSIKDAGVATIDTKTGEVKGVAAGSTIATVTTADGGFEATCIVTVSALPIKATGISIDKETLNLRIGSEETLTATFLPESAVLQEFEWRSGDENIAKVDASGLVTGISEGKVWIYAVSKESRLEARCLVSVGIMASGKAGDLVWRLNEAGVLTLSGYGKMSRANKTNPWWEYRENISKVVIEKDVIESGICLIRRLVSSLAHSQQIRDFR